MSQPDQPTPLPQDLDSPLSDWQQTPESVQTAFVTLLKRVEALEARLNRDSSNRLTAFVGEMAGIVSTSRSAVQDLCASVFGIPLSKGAIQKLVDRVSEALAPHYETIGQGAHAAPVNHLDETSWFTHGARQWLWVMTNPFVAYFQIHPTRSKAAFDHLIGIGAAFWSVMTMGCINRGRVFVRRVWPILSGPPRD
jgi:Transposase IS66 family